MSTTIKQIASELGISPSTVSRALSGYPYVAKTTREKILTKADEMTYTPNLWAQSLVGAGTNIIGCVVLELSNPFFIPMLRAIEDITDQRGYITFIGESRRDLETEKQVIERLRRIRVSGVVITPVLSDLSHLEKLEKEGVPVVVAGRNPDKFDSVNVDNVKSGMLAGKHFVEMGFKKIAYVQSGDPFNYPERDRLIGFKKTLAEAGQELMAIYSVGNNRITGGEKAGDMWLFDSNQPDAVFCSNDLLAMGFVQRIVRQCIQIPDDVAVLGHDDIPFADTFVVPLSTIAMPKFELGEHAVNLLMERIADYEYPHEPKMVTLEPELIIRESCA